MGEGGWKRGEREGRERRGDKWGDGGEGKEVERTEEEEEVMTILRGSNRVGKAGSECSTTSEILQFLIPVDNLVQQLKKTHIICSLFYMTESFVVGWRGHC